MWLIVFSRLHRHCHSLILLSRVQTTTGFSSEFLQNNLSLETDRKTNCLTMEGRLRVPPEEVKDVARVAVG